jgi:hypothetical protein
MCLLDDPGLPVDELFIDHESTALTTQDANVPTQLISGLHSNLQLVLDRQSPSNLHSLQTSIPDIYAVGECASWENQTFINSEQLQLCAEIRPCETLGLFIWVGQVESKHIRSVISLPTGTDQSSFPVVDLPLPLAWEGIVHERNPRSTTGKELWSVPVGKEITETSDINSEQLQLCAEMMSLVSVISLPTGTDQSSFPVVDLPLPLAWEGIVLC